MDISSSEADEGTARLSLSLVSYGSDIEDADSFTLVSNQSSETLVPNAGDMSREMSAAPSDVRTSEEDYLVLSVAKQLGLSGVSEEKMNQLSSSFDKMMASQKKYVQSKLFLDATACVVKNSTKLSTQTGQRVEQVLDHITLLDYVTPPDSDSTHGVFGISAEHLEEQFPNELTAVDLRQLREALEEEIALKHQKLLLMNKRHTDILSKISRPVDCESSKCAEQRSTSELLSLRQKLDCEFATHEALLVELDKVASNLTKLKLETLNDVNSSRVDTFNTRCAVLKSHIQYVKNQIVKDIYLEDKHLIDASVELKTNLELAVTQAKYELSLLQKKDAEHEKLRGTQYDRLVEEYHELRKQIARKEYALKSLNSSGSLQTFS